MSRARWFVMLCALVVLASTALTTGALTAAQADPADGAGSTFVAMHGESDATFVPGGDALWEADGSTSVSASGSMHDGTITVHVSGDHSATFTFAAPTGQSLYVGMPSETAHDMSDRPARSPGIAISYDGRTCEATGRFIVMDASADLSRLAIGFELECDGSVYHDYPTHDFGEIRIDEDSDIPGVFLTTHAMEFPDAFPNGNAEPIELRVYNTSATQGTSTATLSSPDDAFTLRDNGCPGLDDPLENCSITVLFRPHLPGDHVGELDVTDAMGVVHRVSLHGTGIQANTSWTSVIEDDAFVKPAGTYHLDPATVEASSGSNEVWIGGASGDDSGQDLQLSGPDGSHFEAGDTFETDDAHPFGQLGFGPSINFDRGFGEQNHRSCSQWTGHFTIYEAVYVDGGLQRFSATYAARCYGVKAAGSVMGSIAFNATEPAQPVPAELPRDTVPPAAVTDLTMTPTSDGADLHWTPSVEDDYENAVWCLTSYDAPAPTVPPAGCHTDPAYQIENDGVRQINRGTAETWTLWNRDYWGNLSSPVSIRPQGSLVTMGSELDAAGAGMRLTGKLTDLAHQGLGGRPVDIYVGKGMDDLGMAYQYADESDSVYTPWTKVGSVRTAADGTFSGTFPLRPGLFYEGRYFGEGLRGGNHSKPAVAAPDPTITLSASQDTSARSRLVRLRAREVAGRAGDRVTFQRLVKGRWHRLGVKRMARAHTTSIRYAGRRGQRVRFRAVLRSTGHPTRISRVVRVRIH